MRALILLLIPSLAWSQVEVGPTFNVYDSDRIKSEVGAKASVGKRFYLWGSYEHPRLQLVGQNMGAVELWGAGLGFRHELNDRLELFGEFGYFWPSTDPADNIRDEAVATSLRKDHGEPGLHWEHTVYKLSSDYGARLGLSYAATKRTHLSLAYRYLSLNEALDACTGPDSGCEFPVSPGSSHWQNRKTIKLNSFEIGAGIRF